MAPFPLTHRPPKKHEHDVEERDKEVHRIAERFHLHGFEVPPYSREQLIQFRQQLDELLRSSLAELESLEVYSNSFISGELNRVVVSERRIN